MGVCAGPGWSARSAVTGLSPSLAVILTSAPDARAWPVLASASTFAVVGVASESRLIEAKWFESSEIEFCVASLVVGIWSRSRLLEARWFDKENQSNWIEESVTLYVPKRQQSHVRCSLEPFA